MPSGLVHGCSPAGRAAARTSVRPARRHLGEVLRNAHFESSSRTRPRNAERIDPHGTGVVDVGDDPLPRLARQHDVRRSCRTQRRDEVGAPVGVRRVGAGQADDRLAGVGREHRLDPVGRAGHLDGDAAGGEQVGGEGGARGVRGDRAHGGEEDRAGGGLGAQGLEGGAVVDDLAAARQGSRSGSDLAEVRELRDPGQRARAVRDAGVARSRDRGDALRDAPRGLRRRSRRRPRSAELGPAGDREVVGELLDGVRAAGRVGDRGDVGLVDQQRRRCCARSGDRGRRAGRAARRRGPR